MLKAKQKNNCQNLLSKKIIAKITAVAISKYFDFQIQNQGKKARQRQKRKKKLLSKKYKSKITAVAFPII